METLTIISELVIEFHHSRLVSEFSCVCFHHINIVHSFAVFFGIQSAAESSDNYAEWAGFEFVVHA